MKKLGGREAREDEELLYEKKKLDHIEHAGKGQTQTRLCTLHLDCAYHSYDNYMRPIVIGSEKRALVAPEIDFEVAL